MLESIRGLTETKIFYNEQNEMQSVKCNFIYCIREIIDSQSDDYTTTQIVNVDFELDSESIVKIDSLFASIKHYLQERMYNHMVKRMYNHDNNIDDGNTKIIEMLQTIVTEQDFSDSVKECKDMD